MPNCEKEHTASATGIKPCHYFVFLEKKIHMHELVKNFPRKCALIRFQLFRLELNLCYLAGMTKERYACKCKLS